jgi:hypothetical protein
MVAGPGVFEAVGEFVEGWCRLRVQDQEASDRSAYGAYGYQEIFHEGACLSKRLIDLDAGSAWRLLVLIALEDSGQSSAFTKNVG